MAAYTLHAFTQSSVILDCLAAWLARIAATPRWRPPYELMPGHPLPAV